MENCLVLVSCFFIVSQFIASCSPSSQEANSASENTVTSAVASSVTKAPQTNAVTDPAELARWQQQAADVSILRDNWGIAHIYGKTDADTKRMYGTSGNSFVAVVEFGDRLRARAITVGGLQSNPDSPHFDDQAEMYANGEFRDVLFYREDVEANLEREYTPGL